MLLEGFKFAAETQICLSIPYAVVFLYAQDYKFSKTYQKTKHPCALPED